MSETLKDAVTDCWDEMESALCVAAYWISQGNHAEALKGIDEVQDALRRVRQAIRRCLTLEGGS